MIKHSLVADQEREVKLNELGDTLARHSASASVLESGDLQSEPFRDLKEAGIMVF